MKKKDKLKELIKMAGPESPSTDFTQLIMEQLTEDVIQEEVGLKKTLLSNEAESLPAPSLGFERELMAQLKPTKKKRREIALIPKWILATVYISFVALTIFSIIINPEIIASLDWQMPFFDFNSFEQLSSSVPFKVASLCIIVSAILLMMDQVMERKIWEGIK